MLRFDAFVSSDPTRTAEIDAHLAAIDAQRSDAEKLAADKSLSPKERKQYKNLAAALKEQYIELRKQKPAEYTDEARAIADVVDYLKSFEAQYVNARDAFTKAVQIDPANAFQWRAEDMLKAQSAWQMCERILKTIDADKLDRIADVEAVLVNMREWAVSFVFNNFQPRSTSAYQNLAAQGQCAGLTDFLTYKYAEMMWVVKKYVEMRAPVDDSDIDGPNA